MSNIISMKDFKKSKLLEKDIFSFFSFYDPHFYSFLNDNQLITIINTDISFYFFLEYVDEGIFTTSPSIDDRYENIRLYPRISKGEWVVKIVFELCLEDSDEFLHTLPETSELHNFDYIYKYFSPYISKKVL